MAISWQRFTEHFSRTILPRDCHGPAALAMTRLGYGLPRRLRLLAMTGLGDGLPRACGPRNDKVRGWIATGLRPPHNDRVRGRIAMSATPPRNDTVGAGTTVYRCHCEAPKGPWQSVPRAGSSTPLCSSKHARGREGQCIAEDDCQQRDGLPRRFAPRDDRGNRSPGADHRSRLSLRGPKGAAPQGGPSCPCGAIHLLAISWHRWAGDFG